MPPAKNGQDYRSPGEPTDISVYEFGADGKRLSAVTQVHTELGVPIYFDTRTSEFSAPMTRADGRGSNQSLHGRDFHDLVLRVRQRALIVPVRAYRIHIAGMKDRPRLEIQEVAVVEFHKGRDRPFVAVAAGEEHASKAKAIQLYGAYLPTADQVVKLLDLVRQIIEENVRHEEKSAALLAQRDRVYGEMKALTENDIRYTQATATQQVDAGLAVFDVDGGYEEVDGEHFEREADAPVEAAP